MRDDFGFQEYLGKTSIVVPPASHEPRKRVVIPKLKLWSGQRIAISTLATASVFFGCNVMIARSSAQMDGWRAHSLNGAYVSGSVMAMATCFLALGYRHDS